MEGEIAGRTAIEWSLARGNRMPIAKRLTIDNLNLDDPREIDAFDDQLIAAGMERVRAEGDELRRKGMLDKHGNLLVKSSI